MDARSVENGGRSPSGGIHLFRVAGIGIRLDISWFIVLILIVWSLSAGYFPRNYPGQSPLSTVSIGPVVMVSTRLVLESR